MKTKKEPLGNTLVQAPQYNDPTASHFAACYLEVQWKTHWTYQNGKVKPLGRVAKSSIKTIFFVQNKTLKEKENGESDLVYYLSDHVKPRAVLQMDRDRDREGGQLSAQRKHPQQLTDKS